MKKGLFITLRVLIAFLLIYLLLRKVDLKKSLSLFARFAPTQMADKTPLGYLFFALLSFFLFIIISNIRWKILLDFKGLNFTSGYLLKIYLVSLFFNNLLPTAIGGDVMRVAYTVKKEEGIGTALSVTLMDRLIGFVGLFAFALLATLALLSFKNPLSGVGVHYLILCIVGFLLLFGGTVAILSEVPYRLLRGLALRIRFKRLGEKIDSFLLTLHSYKNGIPSLVQSFLLSLLVQLTLSSVWYFSGLSLIKNQHSTIHNHLYNPLYYFLFIPLVGIITILPITLGGLGVRENAFVLFFKGVGLTKEEGLGISLLFLMINYFYSLIGGLIFIFIKRKGK